MGRSKVIYGGETLIDLTGDNISADKMFVGTTAHGADGEPIAGEFTLDAELSAQNTLIAQIQTALQGKAAGGAPENLDDVLSEQEALIARLQGILAEKASGGSGLPEQEKTVEITENGDTEVTPDEGYTLSKVSISVEVPVPDGYVKPSGTLEVTENGTHDVSEYASVDVNISTSGGTDTRFADAAMGTLLVADDDTVTTARQYAFAYIDDLMTVRLSNLKSIGVSCFRYCPNLESVDLPNLSGTLQTYSFQNGYKLKTVNIPKITAITTSAFQNCEELERLELGNIGSISGTNVFNGCAKLTALIIRRTATSVTTLGNVNTFTGTPIASGTGYIYVPATLVDSYKAATNWSSFAAQIRAIEDYPEICGG